MTRPLIQIIYVPGLGDGYDSFRTRALKRWSRPGVSAQIVTMKWRDLHETYAEKQQRLQDAIDVATADRIVLVGESAGGSMVVAETLRANSKVDRCITICGKNSKANRVSPSLYAKNPAFRNSMLAADQAIKTMNPKKGSKKFTVFYSPYDPVVQQVDTILPGAKMKKIPMIGHLLSIVFVLYLYKNAIIKEAYL